MGEEELSFEETFARLEKTAQALEAGGLTLEQALAYYEEGMRLVKLCRQKLDAAALRIQHLCALPEEEPAP